MHQHPPAAPRGFRRTKAPKGRRHLPQGSRLRPFCVALHAATGNFVTCWHLIVRLLWLRLAKKP